MSAFPRTICWTACRQSSQRVYHQSTTQKNIQIAAEAQNQEVEKHAGIYDFFYPDIHLDHTPWTTDEIC